MSWIKNKIRSWLSETETLKGVSVRQGLNSDASTTFSIYEAVGGKIIEFRRYDSKMDRSNNTLYIVGKEEELGEKLSKILTIETLKN